MELAERLGMTLAELRESMSGAEQHRWMMLDKLRASEREKAERAAKRKHN